MFDIEHIIKYTFSIAFTVYYYNIITIPNVVCFMKVHIRMPLCLSVMDVCVVYVACAKNGSGH